MWTIFVHMNIIQLHISLFLVKLCHTTLCRQFYSFTSEITNCFFRTLQHLFTILLAPVRAYVAPVCDFKSEVEELPMIDFLGLVGEM